MSTTNTGVIGGGSQILADPYATTSTNGYKVYWPFVPDSFRAGNFKVQANGAVAGGRNEIQSVVITGIPTGGTFTLTVLGFLVSALAYNITAAALATAINAAIGKPAVRVTGTNPSFLVEYVNDYGLTDVAVMTKNNAGLTGGTSPDITIATPVAGIAGPTSIVVDPTTDDMLSGRLLSFPNGRVAILNLDAPIGTTTLTVKPLGFDIADNEQADALGHGPKVIPCGWTVGKLGSPSGKEVYPSVRTSNPAFAIAKEDIVEGSRISGRSGHGFYEGGNFLENRLPEAVANAGTLPSAIKTELGPLFIFNKKAENNAPTW